MKILFYDMGSYTYNDLLHFLQKAGHTCKTVYYHFPDKFNDVFFCERFAKYLKEDHYDAVISVNFFPLVAQQCNEHQIKYLSWCYDSPLEDRLQDYFHYETNYIFLFDRIETQQYKAAGFNQVFHLPLAVHTERLNSLAFTSKQIAAYQADISFVGQLYHSPLETLLHSSGDFIKGYIEGILQAQLRIYGYYLIDDLITDDLLEQINNSFKKIGQTSTQLNRKGLSYAIATQVTQLERSFLLEQLAELYDTRFYTTQSVSFGTPVKVCGAVGYFDEMPCVFKNSKINLNPTLKCIQSGIPLRALDVMGSQGLLLSNYQPELAEYFEDGKDLVMYSSMEDAIAKADFYMQNEYLRKEIAQNGYEKTKTYFNYPDRIESMFHIAEL